jgi:hypothetical protein
MSLLDKSLAVERSGLAVSIGHLILRVVAGVVAVIAILSALLLPALGRAKAKAQRPVCMNNLRQINLGIRMYADDSSDAFPPPTNNFPPNAFTSYTKLMRSYLGMTGASSERAKIFACPADTFHYDYDEHAFVSQGLHLQPGYDYSSYAFNGGNFPLGKPPVTRWPGIAGRKLNSIKEAAKTVLVSELPALLPYSWHQPAGASGHDNNAQDVVSFVDGHVSFIKVYWDATNEAWQYEPPPAYGYKWTGD